MSLPTMHLISVTYVYLIMNRYKRQIGASPWKVSRGQFALLHMHPELIQAKWIFPVFIPGHIVDVFELKLSKFGYY